MGLNAGTNPISQRSNLVQHHSHDNYGGYRELHVEIKNFYKKRAQQRPLFLTGVY